MVDWKPGNYPMVSVALAIEGAAAAIEFYKDVLGAVERVRYEHDGKVGHAELAFGESLVMVSDEYPDMGVLGPKSIGGSPVTLSVYVPDADAAYAAALEAGATAVRPVEDQFYGDRSGQFFDPWGHRWNVSTHIADVDSEELERRAMEVMEG